MDAPIWRLALTLLSAQLLLAGCDGPSPSDGDGDSDVDGDADGDGYEIAPPAPPVAPAPPQLTPCPEGWREVAPEGPEAIATCDPWPESGRDECEEDEAHFPGEPGCSRVGSSCPAGQWAEDIPTDREVVYVLAGAAAGGDGTEASPFATIAEAVAASSPGAAIALGRGTYDEAVELDGGRALWGACVAETTVTCSAASEAGGTITVIGAGSELRGLRVGGERVGVVVEGVGASAHVEGVVVHEATRTGIRVLDGASLTARSLVVRQTRRQASGERGTGLQLETGASGEVSRAVFDRNRRTAIGVFDPETTLSIEDAALLRTESDETISEGGGPDLRGSGIGLALEYGAEATATRVVVEGNRFTGVYAGAAGSTVRLDHVLVRDTASDSFHGLGGYGLSLVEGARADVLQTNFDGNHHVGIVIQGAGSSALLEDVVVRETLGVEGGATPGAFGRGLDVMYGAEVAATRLALLDNRDIGAGFGEDSVGTLTDLLICRTEAEESTGLWGRGLDAMEGARVEVERGMVLRSRELGVSADGEGTRLVLRDVEVRETLPELATSDFGRGMSIQRGAELEARGLLLEANHDVALSGALGARLSVADVVLRGTRSRVVDGWFGRALELGYGARGDFARVVVEDNQDVGIAVGSEETVVTMTDVVVVRTSECACHETTCLGRGAGTGVAALGGASLDIRRFLISESALAGVQLARGTSAGFLARQGGVVDLHDGEVSHNVVGVNVQTEGFDIERLMDNVTFVDNQRDLDTEQLAAPAIGDPIPSE